MFVQNGFFVLLMFIKYSSSAKREVVFRSDWALCCRFRTVKTLPLSLRFRAEQSFLGASDEPLRYAAGSRANRCLLRESVVLTKRQQHEVGHEGVITDVMVLAFVPLTLIPKESPSLHSNQLIHIAYIFYDIINRFCSII